MTHSRLKTRQHGFTLLEVLIAAAVFAIMGLMAYGGLNMLIQQRRQSDAAMQRLAQIQRGIMLISQDLQQLRGRGIRGPYRGDFLPALNARETSQYALIFTRGGWSNPLGQPRASLQRVAYRIEEDGLIRYSWRVLDQAQDSVPLRTLLISDVDRMTLRFMARDGEWQSNWPAAETSRRRNDPQASNTLLPHAVEIALTLSDYGRITRLYPVAGS